MKIAIALFCFIAAASAYTIIIHDAMDPARPDQCYDARSRSYYNVGQSYDYRKCEEVHCSLNDHKLTYTG